MVAVMKEATCIWYDGMGCFVKNVGWCSTYGVI